MKAFLLGVIAALLIAAGAALVFPGLAKAEPVFVDNRCSGTYLGNGYVLTAAHCVRGETETILRKTPAIEEDDNGGWTAKVVLTDHLHDIAIVKFDKVLVKNDKSEWKPQEIISPLPFTATKVSCEYPKLRQHYVMKGFPAGQYVETIGYIAGDKRKVGPWPVVFPFVGAGYFGSSGSGVYNQITDTVDGVTVGIILGSGILFMVPTAEICGIIPREIQ